jgi:probable F420-dependent oxidoreductase
MRFVFSLAFEDPLHYTEVARFADGCGWDGIVVSDHVVHPQQIDSPYPYTADAAPRWEAPAPWPDAFVAIGAMAAVTERIRFFTGIYVLPMRNPFLCAKAIGTAAVLSRGRVELGIGVGWMKEEFDLLGQSFGARGKRADEMVEVMRTLWSGGMVEHHGEFYDFDPLQMSPAVKDPIPILAGGLSEPALRRAARLDGWVSDLHSTEELAEIVTTLRAYRAESGRGSEPLTVMAACTDAFDVAGYQRLEALGVTHLQTKPWALYGLAGSTLEEKQQGLRRFAKDVIERMPSPR